jgi:hypothetical protein
MPTWLYTVSYEDEIGGTTSKQFKGDFADYAAASAAASALLTDLQAATNAGIQETRLTEVNIVSGAVGAGSRVFEVVDSTLEITNNKRANFKLPSPVPALFTGNALDTTSAVWTDVMANFTSDWSLSDGDQYVSTIRGKRAFVSSGKTNLPA